jgi:hypothetical protein
MSNEFIEENFGRWIRSVTIEEDEDRVETLRTASAAAAKDLASHEFSAVLAAHGDLNEEAAAWLGQHLRAVDDSFLVEGNEELLKILAAVTIMTGMLLPEVKADAALCALAVNSAQFSGLSPVLEELPQVARNRLTAMGQHARQITVAAPTSYVVTVPAQRKETNDAGEVVVDIGDALADIATLGKSLKKLAAAVDSSVRPALARQTALDEEVEMLWWVVSDADEDGKNWSDQTDLGRAVNGAVELAERTKILPEPPSGAALLRKLLGKAAKKSASLADVAQECVEQDIEKLQEQEHILLPIASACEAIRKFATDEDQETWRRAVQNRLGLDPDRKHSLAESSVQLYRELQILSLRSE